MNSGKPGTMFYFDILPALEKLSVEKVGTLFLASMRYAQTGEVPSFDDIVLDFAWELISPILTVTVEDTKISGRVVIG